MAWVVFLRGVNVGGHKAFRPSVVAKDLAEFDVVNVGAAGRWDPTNRRPGAAISGRLVVQPIFGTAQGASEVPWEVEGSRSF